MESEFFCHVQFEIIFDFKSVIAHGAGEAVRETAPLPSKCQQWTLYKPYRGRWVGFPEADEDSCAHDLLRECSLGRPERMGGKQDREGRKPSKMHVSVTYCCITNFPKLESETINVYYLIVSVRNLGIA